MPALLQTRRDRRVDVLRGAALLTIFIDHVPGNFLGTLTLRNFGFSDAAELFVLLAGFSSMMAYGRLFERSGAGTGLRRLALRCARIYVFQVGLLLTTFALIQLWADRFGLHPRTLDPLLTDGMRGIKQGLLLHALPSNLNILPLYIILLALFPLLYFGIRSRPGVTLAVSGALWAAANLDHGINLTNWFDGQGWFFNPFAWQFLFTIGLFGAQAYAQGGQAVPSSRPVLLACWAYLGLALLAAAPWTNWGIAWRLMELDPDKTALSPLRLINVLAFIYVLMCSGWFAGLAGSRGLRLVEMCGRHSLEVFSVGTLGSLIGHLVFCTFGTGWQMQVLVNGGGFAAMIAVAMVLERQKRGGTVPRRMQPWQPGWR